MNFIDVQNEFMAHIRQPELNKKPDDIQDRRMAVYRDLFFNNINGFISSGFPVLKTLYTEQQWLALIRMFFSEHDCSSPYFLDIAGEFINYLSSNYQTQSYDPAFMLELAHYEWIELDVAIAKSDIKEMSLSSNELTSTPLFLSSIARNLSYQFPVQTISVDFCPQEASPTPHYFVVYRDENDDVQFLATNAMTALLLSIIDNQAGVLFDEVCNLVLKQAPQFSLEQIEQGALSTLSAMCERGIIVTKNQN
ncbi:putative DNA-binding domain-containing protein [Pseudoalteromonas sp. MMG010]|uniref:HvfC family RiPP maturation protein n=1 Tax=Pseudoalteromonas sp. MMG010 TaxID=2822685 RepID=UPI001B39E2C3|nr:putative DNA-binding domain-containing protein [Pseudoalteromonas sp. MMG010]